LYKKQGGKSRVKYKQYLAEYEAETGRKAGDFLRQYVEALDAVAAVFEGKGREDAAAGRNPLSKEDLLKWVKENVRAELVEITAEAMHEAYAEGYGHSVTQEGMEIPV
jgi:hypothetical protein